MYSVYSCSAVHIVPTFDVYLCNLQELEIQDYESTVQLDLGRSSGSRAKQSQADSIGSLQKRPPKPCGNLLWDRDQDRLIRSSANNILAAKYVQINDHQ